MITRDFPCHSAAARPRFSAIRRNAPTVSSEIAIIATATKLVRFETQIRRSASRKKYENVLEGISGSRRPGMNSREDMRMKNFELRIKNEESASRAFLILNSQFL